jgi:hypothetical protein
MSWQRSRVDRDELDAFLAQVEQACRDLPERQRRELIAHLGEHLREIDATGRALKEQLGSPEDYARELRAAMDLPPPLAVERRQGRLRRPRMAAALVLAGVGITAAVVVMINASEGSAGCTQAEIDSGGAEARPALPTGGAYLGKGRWAYCINRDGRYAFTTDPFTPAFPLKNFSAAFVIRNGKAQLTGPHFELHDVDRRDRFTARITFAVSSYSGAPELEVTATQCCRPRR